MTWTAGLVLLLTAAASLWSTAGAEGPNQAGLVIQFGDDHVETQCIAFEENEIAGNDLLARSGLELVIDATSGLGVTVCQIEGQGCSFPAEHCFCQCMGGEGCRYWNYFYRDPGDDSWTYSPLGALLRQVRPGSLEAWVWGDGRTPPDETLDFEAVCSPTAPAVPQATATGAPTATPLPVTATPAVTVAATAADANPGTAAPTVVPPLAETAAPSPTHQAAASPTPRAQGGRGDGASYLVFGLLVLGLVLIAAVVWLRRR